MPTARTARCLHVARVLGWLGLGMAMSSAAAYVPVPEEPKTKDTPAKEIRRFIGHDDAVWSVALSPDNRFALSGSYDQSIRLWETATGKEIRRFQGHSGAVLCVTFSADGKFAVSASADGTVRLWDVASRNQAGLFQ